MRPDSKNNLILFKRVKDPMTELAVESTELKALGTVLANLETGKKKYLLEEIVKLRKCDLKDVKKRRKIVQIC